MPDISAAATTTSRAVVSSGGRTGRRSDIRKLNMSGGDLTLGEKQQGGGGGGGGGEGEKRCDHTTCFTQ